MNEEERWTMHGLDYDDPACIRTVEELERLIEEIAIVPTVFNGIPDVNLVLLEKNLKKR